MIRVDGLSLCCADMNDSRWNLLSFCSSYLSVPAYVYRSARRVRLSVLMASRLDPFAGPDNTSTLRISMPTRSEEHLNGVVTQYNDYARMHKHTSD